MSKENLVKLGNLWHHLCKKGSTKLLFTNAYPELPISAGVKTWYLYGSWSSIFSWKSKHITPKNGLTFPIPTFRI